ncbi:MAG: DNA polymerase III subunit gamma/tau [Bacteroidales bacterium]|nr:DNA polymerase III subunit gamma/tau [Candidatus Latescibacterota bacterium]
MTYLVLARKWRPRTFTDVIGQDHVTLTLKKAVEKDRLAHAYLFSGPRGCGKTSTARLLAKVINCEDRQGSEPCDKCPSCTAVNEGTHLDMIEIDGASNRGIDEIRDLREKIGYASSQSASKIYIIDEVHMLTPQAFNALLKTLEEPPPHVYLIFATTEPHKVPATILSRCQRFNFKRLELSELSGQLEMICEAEKIDFDPESLMMISRRADGSMRDVESLLDQCISASDGKIDLETVRGVLGLVDSRTIQSLLDAVATRDRKGALAIVDSVVSSGMDIEEFFLAYLEGIRNLLVLSVSGPGETRALDLTSTEMEQLSRTVSAFNTEDLLMLFRQGARAYRELKGASHPRYHLEASVTEAASWESAVELSELLGRLDGGSRGSGSGDGAKVPGGPSQRKTAPPSREEGRSTASEIPGPPSGSASIDRISSAERSSVADDNVDSSDISTPKKKYARLDENSCGSQEHDNPALSRLGGPEQWERFLAQVREAKLTLGIWLMSARVSGLDGDRLSLSFSPQNRFACEMIREEKNKRYIESQLERFFGRKYFVITGEPVKNGAVDGAGSGKTKSGKDASRQNNRLEELVQDAPIVKRLIEEFDGELFKD